MRMKCIGMRDRIDAMMGDSKDWALSCTCNLQPLYY